MKKDVEGKACRHLELSKQRNEKGQLDAHDPLLPCRSLPKPWQGRKVDSLFTKDERENDKEGKEERRRKKGQLL